MDNRDTRNNPRKLDTRKIRLNNRWLIYEYIRDNGPVSRQDLVLALRVSFPTVTQNVLDLEKAGLIEAAKMIHNTGGRNAQSYQIIPDAKIALGVNLSKNHISVVSLDLTGKILHRKRTRIPFNLDSEEYLKKIGEVVEDVIDASSIRQEQLLPIGVTVPGLIAVDGESVSYGMTLGFTGKKKSEICKYIPYPTILLHDSYSAGYAEVNGNKGLQNAFYIMLSSSVGGANIFNNNIWQGDSHKGAEIAHFKVSGNEKLCYCGKKGCYDTLGRSDVLDSMTDGNLEAFFQLLEQKNEEAWNRWTKYLDDLALQIHNVRLMVDGRIILGGYIGALMEPYLPLLYERVDQLDPYDDYASDYLTCCVQTVEACAVGSALVCINDYFTILKNNKQIQE